MAPTVVLFATIRPGHPSRLVGAGKPKKVALVAAMGKILRRVAAVAKRGTKWTKDP